jgi:putative transposase
MSLAKITLTMSLPQLAQGGFMKRSCIIENNSFHHVYSKSIYLFEIFTSVQEYERMTQLIEYYRYADHPLSFTHFCKKFANDIRSHGFKPFLTTRYQNTKKIVDMIAYCLMPTHVHFVLRQSEDKGIETFMRLTLNAYSKYFNLRHNRRGPLWEHRFGNRLIVDEAGLNKRIEYVHQNPVECRLVDRAHEWPYSSAKDLPNTGCWEG